MSEEPVNYHFSGDDMWQRTHIPNRVRGGASLEIKVPTEKCGCIVLGSAWTHEYLDLLQDFIDAERQRLNNKEDTHGLT